MIQNIQIVQLVPPEVYMAKNKMLKLDVAFSLTSSFFSSSILSLFSLPLSWEIPASDWGLEKALIVIV